MATGRLYSISCTLNCIISGYFNLSDFENTLNELFESVRLIKKIDAVVDNKDCRQYTLTSFGKEILSFIDRYERFMAIPNNQQTLFEVESGSEK